MMIMYDEASHAQEPDIWWLISRLRTKAKMTPSIWLTCNPDMDSYLLKYVEPYIYPKGHALEGRANPDVNGNIRYLIRQDGVIQWGDSISELKERYGEKVNPLSVQVLLGTIYDNPKLIENSPEYLSNLESLPRADKERLLHGNWYARPSASGFFKREWVEEVPFDYERQVVKRVRAYDCAGSLKSESNPDPDYTCSVLMAKLKDGTYLIEEVHRFRARYGEVIERILENAQRDGNSVEIILPEDSGAAGKMATGLLIREITAFGYICRTKPTSKSKIERFRPFAAAAENGLIRFIKKCGYCDENKIKGDNDFVYSEMEVFDGGRAHHDDIVDSMGDAFTSLAKSLNISHFDLPIITSSNPFKLEY